MDDRQHPAHPIEAEAVEDPRHLLKKGKRFTETVGPKGERYRTRTRKIWGQWPQELALHNADMAEVRRLLKQHFGGKVARSLVAKSGLVRITIGCREVRAKSLTELLKKLPASTSKG